MKNIVPFILTVTIFMAACSLQTVQTSWSKPGAQPGDFERDQEACEEDQGVTGLKGEAGFVVCMQKEGWFLIEEPVQ